MPTLCAVEPNAGVHPRSFVARLLLDDDGHFERQLLAHADPLCGRRCASRDRLAQAGCQVPEIEAAVRDAWVGRVLDGIVTHTDSAAADVSGDRLDAVLTHRLWGSLVLAVVMIVLFSAVFNWAEAPMNWIEAGVGAVAGFLQETLPDGALRSLLADGVVGGIGAVIVFLPQIALLFFLSLLEECGYLTAARHC